MSESTGGTESTESVLLQQLGLRRVLNAAGALTAVGGGLLPPHVIDAMRDIGQVYVDMHEFQTAVGDRIARLTNNEAAMVTSGAAAAVAISTMTAITNGDPREVMRLSDHRAVENRVIVQHPHRSPYDLAVNLGGGRVVQIGNSYQTFPWELEGAIDDGCAMVLFVDATDMGHGGIDLETTVAIAHRRGVPVVVDAAAQLPPHTNLWRYTRECGADAAIFSGGKHLQGPQSSGLLLGTAEFISGARAQVAPYQRLARALKPGKENIAGVLAAVEHFVSRDHVAESTRWESLCANWIATLSVIPGVHATRAFPNEAGQAIPRVRVDVGSVQARDRVATALWERDPRVHVLREGDDFYLTPETLHDGEHEEVIHAVISVLTTALAAQ